MRIFFKIGLFIVSIVAALIVLFSIYWIFFFDANALKPQVSRQFHKLTGREVIFHGNLEISIFPSIGFKVQNVVIKNIKGFDPKQPYVEAKEADVKVYLLPLLIRHIRVGRILLHDVEVNLIKNKQNKVNWALPGIEGKPKESASDKKIKHKFSVKKIVAKNITINWKNLKKRKSGRISNINLIANKIVRQSFFPIEFTFSAFNQNTKKTTNFSLKSQVKINRLEHQYSLKDIQLEIDSGKKPKIERPTLRFIGNFKITPDGIHVKKSQLIKNGDILHIDNLEVSGLEDVVDFRLANLVKNVKVSADLYSKQFKLKRTTIYDLVAKARSRNRVIQLYPLKAQVFSGKLNGKLTLDARKDALFSRLSGSLSKFDLKSFLEAFYQVKNISGTANFSANLSARGNSLNQIKRTLNGKIVASVNNGVLNGINLERMIRTARSLLSLSLPPLMEKSNQTRFKNSSATLQINNGIVTNKDLKMESKSLIIQGAGTANLAKKTLNYKLETKLKADFWEGDWLVPINITGSFANPNVGLDKFNLLHEVSKNIMPRNILLRVIKIILTPFRFIFGGSTSTKSGQK